MYNLNFVDGFCRAVPDGRLIAISEGFKTMNPFRLKRIFNAMISFKISIEFLSTMNGQWIVEYFGPMISTRFEMIKYTFFWQQDFITFSINGIMRIEQETY